MSIKFDVKYDSEALSKQLRTFLDGTLKLYKASERIASISAGTAGEIAINLFGPLDEAVEVLAKRGGERVEVLVADYFAAKAVAWGMAGKIGEGRQFLARSREFRSGGVFQEWCQEYYS